MNICYYLTLIYCTAVKTIVDPLNGGWWGPQLRSSGSPRKLHSMQFRTAKNGCKTSNFEFLDVRTADHNFSAVLHFMECRFQYRFYGRCTNLCMHLWRYDCFSSILFCLLGLLLVFLLVSFLVDILGTMTLSVIRYFTRVLFLFDFLLFLWQLFPFYLFTELLTTSLCFSRAHY